MNAGMLLGYKSHVAEIRAMPVPMEITLAGDVEGADVWFNGVHLGKTPIQADMDEVLARVPDWREAPEEWHDHDKAYRSRWDGLVLPLARLRLGEPSWVTGDDPHPELRTIYARVELNGERMYVHSHSVSGGSKSNGTIEPCYVRLETLLPRWEEQVALLIQQARLNDYRVDAEWCETAESYHDRVWDVLGDELKVEPELQDVIDAWVSHRYGLDQVRDHDSARKVFEQIVAEADELGGYHTDSAGGRAVEMLVARLDPSWVVEGAMERMSGWRPTMTWGPLTYGYKDTGRFHFGTQPERHWKSDIRAGALVWAHAIWQLDVLLDGKFAGRDNLVEEKITPALLRLQTFRRPYEGTPFETAAALGGSSFERYFQPRLRLEYESAETRVFGTRHISGVEVNRDLYTAAGLRSDFGRAFREKHAYDILEMTEKIVRGVRGSSGFWVTWEPNQIDYLFLDVAEISDNLAVRFWPRFDRLATPQDPSWERACEVRWHYLARMQVCCTPEMFVDVYRRYPEQRPIRVATSLRLLEPELRLEVLQALRAEAERHLGETAPQTYAYQVTEADIDDCTRLMLQIPCEASAQGLLEWLGEDSPAHEQRVSQVARWCRSDELPIEQLRVLAQAESADLRKLVFPPIQNRPTPDRRAILDMLLEDQDESVRKDAEALKADLDALRDREIPLRDP